MKKLINPFLDLEGYDCFGCSPHNPIGLKMEFYEDGNDVVCFWKPSTHYQGWINVLHGGIQSVLLDEIAAWRIFSALQTTGVTSRMETNYLKSVSILDKQLTLRARIKERKRNIVFVECELRNEKNELCTSALCTYFTVPPEKAKTEYHFNGCNVEE